MSARRLLVVRHAKSDQHVKGADHERPLNGRGERDAPALGRWLAEHAGPIDLVLCSSAERAVQTWRLAGAELTAEPALDVRDDLYLAGVEDVLAALRALDPSVGAVVLVGHEPTQSGLSHRLAGAGSDASALTDLEQGFVTSAVAVLETDVQWADLGPASARMVTFAVPRG
jgi:phosphohistidine phosphatase